MSTQNACSSVTVALIIAISPSMGSSCIRPLYRRRSVRHAIYGFGAALPSSLVLGRRHQLSEFAQRRSVHEDRAREDDMEAGNVCTKTKGPRVGYILF